MRRIATLVSFFLLAVPASAQQTQCRWLGNVWTCDQQQQGSGVDWNLGRVRPPTYTPPPPSSTSAWDDYLAQKRAKKVGAKIAAGDCQGALEIALKGGDISLAEQVRGYCKVPPTP